MADSPIKVGGEYVENENHIPNPTDMRTQYQTSGTGAHQRIEEVADVFEVDKVKTAQEIAAALDPDNSTVPSSRVLLPETTTDNETAKEEILAVAEARLDEGVEIGGATPAEREASLDGEEGVEAARLQEQSNAAQNSVGGTGAGTHDSGASSTGSDSGTGDSGDSNKSSADTGSDAKTGTAKKAASSKSGSSDK